MASTSHKITTVHSDCDGGQVVYKTQTYLRGVLIIKGEGNSMEAAHVDAMRNTVDLVETTVVKLEQARLEAKKLADDNAALVEKVKTGQALLESSRRECEAISAMVSECQKNVEIAREALAKVIGVGVPPVSVVPGVSAIAPAVRTDVKFGVYPLIVLLGPVNGDKDGCASKIARAMADECAQLTLFYNISTVDVYWDTKSHGKIVGYDIGHGDYVPPVNRETGRRGLILVKTFDSTGGYDHHHRIENAKANGVNIVRMARAMSHIYASYDEIAYKSKQRAVMVVMVKGAGEKAKKEVFGQCTLSRFYRDYGEFAGLYETNVNQGDKCFIFTDDAEGAAAFFFEFPSVSVEAQASSSSSSPSQ